MAEEGLQKGDWSGGRFECAGQAYAHIPRMKGLREWPIGVERKTLRRGIVGLEGDSPAFGGM